MTVLLTGTTGFVGRNLYKELMKQGFPLLAHSRSQQINSPDSKNNLQSSYLFIEDLAKLHSSQLKKFEVDSVVHCAGLAHTNASKEDFLRVNTDLTLSLAKAAAEAGVKRFVFLSTIGVNGIRSSRPFDASDKPAPMGNYAESKCLAEIGLRELSQKYNMEFVIIRPPLIYGDGAPGNFAKLVKLASLSIPNPLGGIKNSRSFVSIDNLVDFVVCCLTHANAGNETFLVSDGEDISTTEFLRRIADARSNPIKLLPIPVPLLRMILFPLGLKGLVEKLSVDLTVDISKNKEILGWTPPLNIDQSLWFLRDDG